MSTNPPTTTPTPSPAPASNPAAAKGFKGSVINLWDRAKGLLPKPGSAGKPPRSTAPATTAHDDDDESPMERYRRQIESFDEDKEQFLEKIVRWFFMLLAYVAPVIIALAMGREIGDEYSGTSDIWASGWSLGTHTVAYFGELSIAMMTLASSMALRKIKSDSGAFVGKLISALIALLVFSLASGFAQWFIAVGHIHPHDSGAYAMLIFRVVMVPCIDVGSLLYLAIQNYKSLKRYLAEQTQKAQAIRALNESELEIERAQEDAQRRRDENQQYLAGKAARERVMLRIEEIQAEHLIKSAERSLLPPPDEEDGYHRRQLRG